MVYEPSKQQVAKLLVKDRKHLATKHLPKVWERKMNGIIFDINPDINH